MSQSNDDGSFSSGASSVTASSPQKDAGPPRPAALAAQPLNQKLVKHLFAQGQEGSKELRNRRDPDAPVIEGVIVSFLQKSKPWWVREPVFEKPESGKGDGSYKMIVLVTSVSPTPPIPDKNLFLEENPGTLKVKVRREAVKTLEDSLPESFPEGRSGWIEIAVGDMIKMSTTVTMTPELLGQPCLFKGVEIKMLDYYNSKKVGSDKIKQEDGTTIPDPHWKQRVKEAVQTCTTYRVPLVQQISGQKRLSESDLIRYMWSRVPINTRTRFSTTGGYQTLIYVGWSQGKDPAQAVPDPLEWTSIYVPSTDSMEKAFTFNTKEYNPEKAGPGEHPSMNMKKMLLTLQLAVKPVGSSEDAKGRLLKLIAWDEECAPLLRLTRQKTWVQVMSNVFPAIGFLAVCGYNSRSKQLDFNVDTDVQDSNYQQQVLELGIKRIFFDLSDFLCHNAFPVSCEWAAAYLKTDACKWDGRQIDTADPVRRSVAQYLSKLPGVTNLTNYAGSLTDYLNPDFFEIRVLTSQWFASTTTYSAESMGEQIQALAQTAVLTTEESAACLSGDPSSSYPVANDRVRVVYALEKHHK